MYGREVDVCETLKSFDLSYDMSNGLEEMVEGIAERRTDGVSSYHVDIDVG